MFAEKVTCPVAITHPNNDPDKSYDKAVSWAVGHMQDGEFLTVWTVQKNTVNGNPYLENLIRYRDVKHVTGRGRSFFQANGPVVAFYVHRDELTQFNDVRGMTALSVVTWSEPLNVWSQEIGAETLVEAELSSYESDFGPSPIAVPIMDEARAELESLTSRLNLNNSVSGGFEKRDVVRSLNRMRDKGILPDPKAATEWTAAHGWHSDNPKRFGEMVEKAAAGRSFRSRY